MKQRYAFQALGGLMLLTASAQAGDQQLVSNTYVRAYTRPGIDGPNSYRSFYEYAALRTRDTGIQGLSIQASVWGLIEAADVFPEEHRASGDVNLLLLQYRPLEESALRGLEVKLGRQFVSAGPSLLEQLDGADVTYRLPRGVSVRAFGGAISGIRFTRQLWSTIDGDTRYGGNWTAGGRLGYELGERLGVGAGYRLKQYDGKTAFNEVNWDVTAAPVSWLELVGDGAIELTAQRLKQARLATRFQRQHLSATAGYRYVSPDLFIPRTSIFAVFSDETFQEGFIEGDWRTRRGLSLRAEVGGMVYGETCVRGAIGGQTPRCDDTAMQVRALAQANARFGFAGRHRAVIEAERRGAPEGGYWRVRLGGSLRVLERLSLIFDVDGLVLDDPNEAALVPGRDHRWGVSGSSYIDWQLRHDLDLLAGGQALSSPLNDAAGAVTVRLNWTLDSQPRAGGGPVEVTRGGPAASLSGAMGWNSGGVATVGGAL